MASVKDVADKVRRGTRTLSPKAATDGVDMVTGTVKDTISGLTVNTPWRKRILYDRLAHAIYFEQNHPIMDSLTNAAGSIKKGVSQLLSVGSIFNGGASALRGTTQGNRFSREVMEDGGQNTLYFPNSDREDNGLVVRNPMGNKNSSIQNGDSIVSLDRDEITTFRKHLQGKKVRPSIFIVNTSVSPYMYLELQTIPSSISIKPQTSWAVLNSLGRNTPFYHYTGSEDTISFSISWYCNDRDHPEEVLTKCKLLESWCKSDGYSAAPPILRIFSSRTGGMFGGINGEDYILWEAPYEFTGFKRLEMGSHMDEAWFNRKSRNGLPNDNVKPYFIEEDSVGYWLNNCSKNDYIVPTTATQTLTFKRVSNHNLTHKDIIDPSLLKGIKGIKSANEVAKVSSDSLNQS